MSGEDLCVCSCCINNICKPFDDCNKIEDVIGVVFGGFGVVLFIFILFFFLRRNES